MIQSNYETGLECRESMSTDPECCSNDNKHTSTSLATPKKGSIKKDRSNYSKPVVDVLNEWFEQHLEHPYPTEQQRVVLWENTGLTRKQLRVWLINSRKRKMGKIIHGKQNAEKRNDLKDRIINYKNQMSAASGLCNVDASARKYQISEYSQPNSFIKIKQYEFKDTNFTAMPYFKPSDLILNFWMWDAQHLYFQ